MFSLYSIVVKWDCNENCVLSGSHISGQFLWLVKIHSYLFLLVCLSSFQKFIGNCYFDLQWKGNCATSGPDNLPNWVLKEYAEILAPAITDISNHSFRDCKVPRVWKIADVPPVPKAPTISDFNKDLRPISLTSTLSKVAEDFVIER